MARALVILFLLASTCFAWEGGNNSPLTDAAATVGSLRTLGSGALQAMPGDSSPTPGAHRGSHYPGGSDSLADTFTITTRSLTAGAYLTGGGDQSADRTVDLEIGSVSADVTPTWEHIQNKVSVNTGTYLSGGGSLSGNLTLDADIGDISASVTPSWSNLQGHTSVTAGSYLSGGGSLAGSVTLNVLLGDLSVDVTPTWSNVQGKPSTFPPVIGSGAGDAVAGNDARLTDTRNPTGTAGGVLTGTYPDPGLAATAVTPGTYTLPTISVASDGRLTGATSNPTITQDVSNNTTVSGNLIAGTLAVSSLLEGTATAGRVPVIGMGKRIVDFSPLYYDSGVLRCSILNANTGTNLSLPGYSFYGDLDTGMMSPSSNSLQFVTGGLRALLIDASRNATVTLGDAVGAAALMVADSTNTTVTRIDSDGNITTAGSLTSGTLTAGRIPYATVGGKLVDSAISYVTNELKLSSTTSGEPNYVVVNPEPSGKTALSLGTDQSNTRGRLRYQGATVAASGLVLPAQLELSCESQGSNGLLIDTKSATGVIVLATEGTAAANERMRIASDSVRVTPTLVIETTIKQANSGEILITNSGEYRIEFSEAQPDTNYHLSLMSVDPSYGVPTDMRLTRETTGVTLTYTSSNNVSLTYATMGY